MEGLLHDIVENSSKPLGSMKKELDSLSLLNSVGSHRQVELIEETLSEIPQEIEQGTVGEYLYSCRLQSNNVLQECTPECARGLPMNERKCTFPVFYLDDDTVSHIVRVKGDRAYLFCDQDFEEEKMKGIAEIFQISVFDVYVRGEEGDWEYLTSTHPMGMDNKNDESYQGLGQWAITICILFIILILLIILVGCTKKRKID